MSSFKRNCIANQLDLAQSQLESEPTKCKAQITYPLAVAVASHGHIDVLQWLCRVKPNLRVMLRRHLSTDLTILVEAALNGHTQVLRFAHTIRSIAPHIRALWQHAAKYGHTACCEWMYDLCPGLVSPSPLDFVVACSNGHLALSKSLVYSALFNDNQPDRHLKQALIKTCTNGHLRMAEWLCKEFPGAFDYGPHWNPQFVELCKKGYMPCIQLMYSVHPFDITCEDHAIIRQAAANKRTYLLDWLCSIEPDIYSYTTYDNGNICLIIRSH